MIYPNWQPSGYRNDSPFNPDPGDITPGGGGQSYWNLSGSTIEPINNYNVKIVGLNVASITNNNTTITNIINSNSDGNKVNDFSLMTSKVINDLIDYSVKSVDMFEEIRDTAMFVLMPQNKELLLGSYMGGIFDGGVRIDGTNWISSVITSPNVTSVASSESSIYSSAAIQTLLRNNAGDESPFNIDRSNKQINLKNELNTYPVNVNQLNLQQLQGKGGTYVTAFYGIDGIQQESMANSVFTIAGTIEYIEDMAIKDLRRYEDLTYSITNREAEKLAVDISAGDGFSFREKDIKYPCKFKLRITNTRSVSTRSGGETPITEECEFIFKGNDIPVSSLSSPVYHAVWGNSLIFYLWGFSYNTNTADGIRYIINAKSVYGGSCKFEAGGSCWYIEQVNNSNATDQLALLSDVNLKIETANLWHDTGHETSNLTPKNTSSIVEVPMLKTKVIHLVNSRNEDKYIYDILTNNDYTAATDDAIYSSLKVNSLLNENSLWENTGHATANIVPKDSTAVVEAPTLKTRSLHLVSGSDDKFITNIITNDETTQPSDNSLYTSLKINSLLSGLGGKWPPNFSLTCYKSLNPNEAYKDYIPDGFKFECFDVRGNVYYNDDLAKIDIQQNLINDIYTFQITILREAFTETGKLVTNTIYNFPVIYNVFKHRNELFKVERITTHSPFHIEMMNGTMPMIEIKDCKESFENDGLTSMTPFYGFGWVQVGNDYAAPNSPELQTHFMIEQGHHTPYDYTVEFSINMNFAKPITFEDFTTNLITSADWILVPA